MAEAVGAVSEAFAETKKAKDAPARVEDPRLRPNEPLVIGSGTVSATQRGREEESTHPPPSRTVDHP